MMAEKQNPAYEPVSGAKECKKEDARYMMQDKGV
jgi:hypothetical protein